MRVDTVICTWNRARLLDKTLTSLHNVVIPRNVDWEVWVVNNGCTDETDEIVGRHADYLKLREIWEPQLGKSHALNTAINTVPGELLLWTDDDVIVDTDWLASYVDAAQRFPDASFFGGPIDPWFEIEPPDWVSSAWDHVSTVFASRQFGDQRFVIDAHRLPFGANLAIRTDVQRRYMYDSRLGRVGPSDVRGEETHLLEQIIADGLRGYWVPQAKVNHFIPRERLTLDYLHRFFFGMGETRTLIDLEQNYRKTSSRTRKAYLRSKAGVYRAQVALLRRVTRPSSWIHPLCRASYYEGRHSRLVEQLNQGVRKQAA